MATAADTRRPKSRGAPETRIVTGILPEERTPRQVIAAFRALLDAGAELAPAGRARRDPRVLLRPRYLPRHEIHLFDAAYYLADPGFDDALGFFVGYVALRQRNGNRIRKLHPRIFYKDSSLVWRVASHFIHTEWEYWIGKGDVRSERGDWVSAEETTNLPYEVQAAFDVASRRRKGRRDEDAVELVLREAPADRIEPYADFVAPRRKAAARYKVNGGRPVARFDRKGDPHSLRFVPGYEPDFERGVLEVAHSMSKFFNGELRKYRILSRNGEIQYQFCASPTHAWVNPPQTLTTELGPYGVRIHDVRADDDVFVPGYEYHHLDESTDPPEIHSQIPDGYAGEPHPLDPSRVDASAWVEELPVIRAFRKALLGG